MANFFELIVQKLVDLKIFDFFLPFVITATLLYALLRKSKFLGEMKENQLLSAIIALSVSFLVFGYPVLVGFTFGAQLSSFFTQLMIIGLLFVMALVFASMFYPDFPKMMSEIMGSPSKVYWFIGIVIGLFVTSGLVGVLFQGSGDTDSPQTPREVILIVAGIIIFIIIIMVAAGSVAGGEQKQ